MPYTSRQQSRTVVRHFVLLLGIWLFASGSQAAAFERLVVFGDSLSDPGNAFVLTGELSHKPYALIPDAPYARGGHHFSNGKTWIEQLAVQLHSRGAGPAFRTPAFHNYAVGGARARAASPFDLATEVGAYLSNPVSANQTLFVIFIGSNDVRDAIVALQTDPGGATSAAILGQAITAIADSIVALQGAGAHTFLIANVPNLALVPAISAQGPTAQFAAYALSTSFNTALTDTLTALAAALPVSITRLDIFDILSAVVSDAQAFDLENVSEPCIIPGTTRKAVCNRPDDYLFWDGIHPTRAGHALLAQAALDVLSPP
jgi:phospholipase/lecithinase/hemolysin